MLLFFSRLKQGFFRQGCPLLGLMMSVRACVCVSVIVCACVCVCVCVCVGVCEYIITQ